MANKKGSTKTGGRSAGTPNKSTMVAAEILAKVKHKINSKKNIIGYNSIEMEVMFIEEAWDIYQNCPPKDGAVYLKMAMNGNEKLMSKEHGEKQTVTQESNITAENIVKAMTKTEMIKDYRPIDDPESGLVNDDEDDL